MYLTLSSLTSSSLHMRWTKTAASLDPTHMLAIIVISAVSALLLATLIYLIVRTIQRRRALAKQQSTTSASAQPNHKSPSMTGLPGSRRQSHWARKDSNVLWSMYMTDEDLAKQFSLGRKLSRMFSIGSTGSINDGANSIHFTIPRYDVGRKSIPSGTSRNRSHRRDLSTTLEKGPLDKDSFESVRLPSLPDMDIARPKIAITNTTSIIATSATIARLDAILNDPTNPPTLATQHPVQLTDVGEPAPCHRRAASVDGHTRRATKAQDHETIQGGRGGMSGMRRPTEWVSAWTRRYGQR